MTFAAGIAVVAAVSVAASVLHHGGGDGSTRSETLVGTSKADVLHGRGGDDRLVGKGGDDRLIGGPGNDKLVGGPGRDTLAGGSGDDTLTGGPGLDSLAGGPGDDRIYARDGAVDRVDCGPGLDHVLSSDPDDELVDCELKGSAQPLRGTIELDDESWTCDGPVDLDLVKVTMRTRSDDAIHLRTNCTGRIGRIEVQTWTQDGVKINAPAPAAHDLVIGGGYIRCYDHDPGAHQDGVQAMGGERIVFRSVEINCSSDPNSQFFVSAVNGGNPTKIVCDGCTLGSGAATTLLVQKSTQSGARNTALCPGRYKTVRIQSEAVDAVNTKNRVLRPGNARCQAPSPG